MVSSEVHFKTRRPARWRALHARPTANPMDLIVVRRPEERLDSLAALDRYRRVHVEDVLLPRAHRRARALRDGVIGNGPTCVITRRRDGARLDGALDGWKPRTEHEASNAASSAWRTAGSRMVASEPPPAGRLWGVQAPRACPATLPL